MKSIRRIIYKLGGYDYKIIEEKINPITSHYGLKYFIPGFSLIIVFLTAGYGGWHFSATLIDESDPLFTIKHILGTLLFAFFIFFVDYVMLNSPRNKWMLYLRGGFSITVGVLVGLLTTLSFFADKINSDLERERNELIEPIRREYDSKIQAKEDELIKQDSITLNSRKIAEVEADGTGGTQKRGMDTIYRLKNNNYLQDLAKLKNLRTSFTRDTSLLNANKQKEISDKEKEFDKKSSLSQMKSLWRLMSDKSVLLLTLIIFLGVTLADLIPLFAKISREYSNEYDPYKKYITSLETAININNEKKIDLNLDNIELLKLRNDYQINKFNEDAIKKMNSLYALEKYQELLDYFKSRNIPEDAIKNMFNKLHDEANKNDTNGE